MTDYIIECQKCGKVLKKSTVVWLELCTLDNKYYFENKNNPMPEDVSQGAFAFGKDCAISTGKRWNGVENVVD